MTRRTFFILGALVLLVLGGLTVWRVSEAVQRRAKAAEATTAGAGTPVEVAQVQTRDLVDQVAVAGNLRALHEADVIAEVPGRVLEVLVDVGRRVGKGQTLARIDDTEIALQAKQAEAGVTAAKAARDTAARDLKAAVDLSSTGGVTANQLVALNSRAVAADAQVEQAEAALGLARERVADAVVKAPFGGVVVRRSADIGMQAAPGLPMFGIADLSSLELVVDVDERVAAKVKPGDAVALRSDTVSDLPAGKVKTVSPMLNAYTRKAQIVVELDNVPGLFGHGGATAIFQLGSVPGALAVPALAVLDDKGDKVVYVLDGNKVRRTVVQVGLRDGDWVEVAGLSAGTSVVVTGNTYLSDGAPVLVRSAADKS